MRNEDKAQRGIGRVAWILGSIGWAASSLAFAGEIRDPARGWDHLWHEVLVDISVTGVVFAIMTAFFIFKFRRRSPGQEGSAVKLSGAAAVAWVVIPTFVFLADDFYVAANGWTLWNAYRQVPENRLEVKLESGMYSWDYTYPNGVKTQNQLVVPAGMPVLLRMTSRDTIHSHYMPDFRVKEDSMPGRVTFLWFLPTTANTEHVVTCTEYCGVMHSYMAGKVIVKTEADYKAWMDQQLAKLTPPAVAVPPAVTAAPKPDKSV
jgi:cytochrome c oxidase subunit 2